MSRSERMPSIFAPSVETTSALIRSWRRRWSASSSEALGLMVFTSRPLFTRMCSTFIGRSSALHRLRPKARVAQAPPLDRIRPDRSGQAVLPLSPDRIGQRPHHAVPVPRLDARGLEDQVTSRYRPADPVGILV